MNRFGQALLLVDALAVGGVELVAAEGGLEVVGHPDEALSSRLAAFSAPAEPDETWGPLEARIARAMHGVTPADRCDTASIEATLQRVRDEGPLFRALHAVVAAPSRAARELLSLPVSYAVGLPYPFTIIFRRRTLTCVCTTARDVFAQAQAQGAAVFVVRELEAAGLAVAQGRAYPADLDRWAERKRRGEWRLTPELAGALEAETMAMLCFGELFEALGAELVDVALHGPVQGQEAT
jgi:hypothetical protein